MDENFTCERFYSHIGIIFQTIVDATFIARTAFKLAREFSNRMPALQQIARTDLLYY